MSVPKLRFKEFKEKWEVKPLGQVTNINPKSSKLPDSFIYIDLESVKNGCLLFENRIDLKTAPSRAQRLLQKNDILYQTVRPYQRNNLLFNQDGDYVASTGYAQIRCKQSANFLFQLLYSDNFVNDVLSRCTGTSYPAIDSSSLSEIQITIPTIQEQTKIADFLIAVDEKIAQLTQKCELLARYKKGVMQQIFSQELRFKDDDGSDFPDWEEKKLGNICNRIIDGTHFSPKSTEGTKKYLTSKNIRNTGLDLFDCNYISEEEHKEIYKRCPVQLGDILLTKDGVNTGNCCMNYLQEEFSLLSSVAVLRGKEEILNNFFLLQLLQSSYGVNEINSHMAGQAIGRITLEKIKSFKFPFPIFQEQTKIANFLTSIDEKITEAQTYLDTVRQYKQGLLQQMFV